jgi:hypothetical protein
MQHQLSSMIPPMRRYERSGLGTDQNIDMPSVLEIVNGAITPCVTQVVVERIPYWLADSEKLNDGNRLRSLPASVRAV